MKPYSLYAGKAVDIAIKDLLRSFRSMFLVTMMLVAPLLLTGLIYFAFGNLSLEGSGRSGGLKLPVIRVVVANLDKPDGQAGLAAGKLLADHLGSGELVSMMHVSAAPDEASAVRAVDDKQADVAVIIPANFTAAVVGESQGAPATVRLYHDPTATIAPGIVQTVVSEFADGFSGATIAVQVNSQQLAGAGLTSNEQAGQAITARYVEWVQSSQRAGGPQILAVRAPSGGAPASQATDETGNGSSAGSMIPLIMAAMMIFFVFFTGGATASTIVTEDEEGTLARLFTTPTSQATVLGGKFIGSLLTVTAQALVLVLAAMLLFGISWGNPFTLSVVLAALVIAAAGFGVFLMSFVRTSRQSGPVLGAVISVTGMLGGLFTAFTPMSGVLDTASLAVPQGWAMRGMRLTLAGASPAEVLGPVLVLVGVGVVLFAVGTLVFRRRFA